MQGGINSTQKITNYYKRSIFSTEGKNVQDGMNSENLAYITNILLFEMPQLATGRYILFGYQPR